MTGRITRRSVAAVVLAIALLPCITATATSASTSTATATSTTPAPAAPQDQDRVIKDSRITESSGLAVSPLHPGVLWTHNDSGHSGQIYAIAKNGRTAATITVKGAQDRDWEAITVTRKPVGTGRPYIAIGDIGDNTYVHPYSRIYILPEPKELVSQSIRATRTIRFTFPGGPRNAEALLADPRTGRLYVVTKDIFSSQIYAIPPSAWPGQTTGVSAIVQAQLVASSNASFITDGAFLPDGRMLLRGYGRLYLLDGPEKAVKQRLRSVLSARLPDQEQGESITVEEGGKVALIGSEGKRSPVLPVDLTALGMASRPSAVKPSASTRGALIPEGSPAGRSGVTSADDGSLPLGPNRSTWLAMAAGGGAILLLAAGSVILISRRR